jgi:hypothetical protein
MDAGLFHYGLYELSPGLDPPRVTGPQRHLRRRQSEAPSALYVIPVSSKDWLRVKMIISITGVALLFMLLVVLYFPPLIERGKPQGIHLAIF